MNRRRIIGLLLLACVAILLVIRGCLPTQRATEPPPSPPRAVFDKSKPFVLTVINNSADKAASTAWLARELSGSLSLAGLHVSAAQTDASRTFRVQVLYSGDAAELRLLAPDQVVERQQSISFSDSSRLQVTRELTKQLLSFLGGSSNTDVESALNFDAATFDSLVDALNEITGEDSAGFTQVGDKVTHALAISKLEHIAKRNPRNARALSALALGYLSVGGPDHQSLLDLAEQTAQQALSLSQNFADAHAALGLAALRRNQWIAARESLDRAAALNPNSIAALEGLACMFADTGQLEEAADNARRALALHPQNVGASVCLSFAKLSAAQSESLTRVQKAKVAVIAATVAMLTKDFVHARELLSKGLPPPSMKNWGEPLLDAAQHPAHVSSALQNITQAALEQQIASTDVLLAGTALRKSDFVFNRLARLHAEREPEPTRILWLPPADFLRSNSRFERVVTEAGLTGYWREYGRPDICKVEPTIYGCGELPKTKSP